MKFSFLILLLSIFINNILSKRPQLLSVSVYEYSIKKDTYNITLINPVYVKVLKNPSKLAYITDTNNKDKNIFENLSKYYNKIWLFFLTDKQEVKKLVNKLNDMHTILTTGIIIPESISYRDLGIEEKERFPIFTIKGELNLTFINYDLRNNKKNTYFIINFTEDILIEFFIIFSSFALISAIVIGVVWNILEKKVSPNYIFGYHERMKYILCAHIFFSLISIFKTITIIRNENYELTVAVEMSLSLSISFFRSLLWFQIYLISCGWNICYQNLDITEQRKIFRLFIFIVLFFWIDVILDNYCGKLWILNISEIKNIALFILITILTVRNIRKDLKMLRRKYNYALSLLQDYAEGIYVKIKILKILQYEILSYFPLFLMILIISKFFLSEYDNPILLLYVYLIPDFILEFSFMFLMRPKIVPVYYNIDLGDMFNEVEGDTYVCVLPKYEEFNEENYKDNIKNIDLNENEIMPIVILGPEKRKNNFLIDDNSSGGTDPLDLEINKYFANIKVGYIEKGE